MSKKVLVIGAGLGGLSTALRLNALGYNVKIVEQYSKPGGRLNSFSKDGFTFDTGPSFFSMSYEFTEFFNSIGVQNPLKFRKLDPLYTVNFAPDGRKYQVYTDLNQLALQFKQIEPDFKKNVTLFLEQAKDIFEDTEYRIVKKNFDSILQYLLGLATVPLKHSPKLFRTMWQELGRYFQSEDVKIIFSLVAFFLGATPFNTPAVYSLLNYTELVHDGYWNVEGGMYSIVESLLELLEIKNIDIQLDTKIVAYSEKDGKIDSFIDQNGHSHFADLFVVNSDAASFRWEILKNPKFAPTKLDKMHWTLAPFTVYLGVKGVIPGLNHHNYYLGDNFKEYADTIFSSTVSPEKPYYYVNASSKSNPDCAPEGCENIFILCPVPDLRFKKDWSDSESFADGIIEDLSKRINFDLKSNTLTRTIWNPIDWKDKFNLYQGSGLGLAHDLNQVGGFRPSNKDEQYSNLYYVGASTIPGTGLPIVIISSKLVAERIQKDNALSI